MRRLKQVYTSEKERESAEMEECKRLSFENSVLCQRIKTLEDETCHLADKLIKVHYLLTDLTSTFLNYLSSIVRFVIVSPKLQYELANCKRLDSLFIQGQVSRAEQAEEMFILKRELVALRRHDGELSEKLKEATRRNCYIDAKLQSVSFCVT